MRAHIIENGIVTNTIEVESLDFMPGLVDADLGGSIGDRYENGEFIKPAPEPEPAPESCTPAQGLVALFAVKGITEDDVLAAIGQIADPVQQYTARIGLQRATTWERTSPTMQAMAALLGLTEQDLDDLYTLAVTVVV